VNLTGTDRWYVLGAALVSTVQAGLTASVARAGQVPGDIAWDDCSCDGALYVSVPRVYRSERFPEESEAPVGVSCQAPYEIAEYTVSVIRCAPQPQGQDLSPDVHALDNAAGLLLQDMTETLAAVQTYLCGLQREETITDFLVNPAQSAGPEGGCVGFVLRVLVSVVP
jgi:hypothetical protein